MQEFEGYITNPDKACEGVHQKLAETICGVERKLGNLPDFFLATILDESTQKRFGAIIHRNNSGFFCWDETVCLPLIPATELLDILSLTPEARLVCDPLTLQQIKDDPNSQVLLEEEETGLRVVKRPTATFNVYTP